MIHHHHYLLRRWKGNVIVVVSPDISHRHAIKRNKFQGVNGQSPAQMMNQNEGNEISNISDNNSRGGPPQNIGTPSVASGSNNAQQPAGEQHVGVGWNGFNYTFLHTNDMRNLILLDSGSTDTVFCNKDFVKNIRPSKTQMKINTNGGVMIFKMICDIPDLGTFWYNEFALTNIINLSHMRQKFKITYDSEFENAIKVHTNKGIVKFPEIRNGL